MQRKSAVAFRLTFWGFPAIMDSEAGFPPPHPVTVTLRNGAVTARIWTGRARRRIRRLSSRGGSGFSVLLSICGQGARRIRPDRPQTHHIRPAGQGEGRGAVRADGRPVVLLRLPRRDHARQAEGLLRGLPDFRDDAYRRVVIDSFERDVLPLQLGGTLPLADIARIEEPDD